MEEATTRSTEIDEDALRRLRAGIGREHNVPQYNTIASEDAIRHYALGIGDDNPLFLDPEYAATTRWGGVIAHPTLVMTCGFARTQGLPGMHALFAGIDLHCHQPIRAGTRITAVASLHDVVEKPGRYSGRQFQQIYETNAGTTRASCWRHFILIRFGQDDRRRRKEGKYTRIERQTWTDETLAPIEAELDREPSLRRGATKRYFDDVKVGDAIGPVIKGPLTATDCICFLMGFGYIFVKAHRQWHEFRRAHPKAGIKNSHGVWDIPERVHWEEEMPLKIGMPRPL